MRQVIALFSGIKSKLQHLHTRITGIFYQLKNRWCQKSQILRNNGNLSQCFFQCIEKIDTRSLFPVPEFCGLIPVRNGIILVKTTEMIDTYDIIEFKAVLDPADPPLITCLFMIFPIIKRIAPQLTCSGKTIRRAACHSLRFVFLIKLEHLRCSPDVRTVKSHINRNVTDDLNSILVGVILQCSPLGIKLILQPGIEVDLLTAQLPVMLHGLLFPVPDIFIPLIPAHTVEVFFYSHIKTIFSDPLAVFFFEYFKSFFRLFQTADISFFQQSKTGSVQFSIVDISGITAKITGITLFLQKQSFFDQLIQIDKIRISSKGGK